MSRRSYGTGSLYVRRDAAGRETWYGQWRAGARLVKRRIGPRREPGTSNGLTKAQAERELRRKIDSERAAMSRERLTIAESRGALHRSPDRARAQARDPHGL